MQHVDNLRRSNALQRMDSTGGVKQTGVITDAKFDAAKSQFGASRVDSLLNAGKEGNGKLPLGMKNGGKNSAGACR